MSNIQVMDSNCDFNIAHCNSGRKLVIYGAGSYGKIVYSYLGYADYFCDKNGKSIGTLFGVPTITAEELVSIGEELDMLLCIKDSVARNSIIDHLREMDISARVFVPFDNVAFDNFIPSENTLLCSNCKELKRVRIINRTAGIIEKMADCLCRELNKLGIDADIDEYPDYGADMNYYAIFDAVNFQKECNSSFLITHVNSMNMINMIKHILKRAQMGICMSKETLDMLVMNGIPREKLCYINPAHDNVIRPRKYVLGITCKCYDQIDNRKRASAILDIVRNLDSEYFEFKIMGEGWNNIVDELKSRGFSVLYYPVFDKAEYNKLMPSLDYYLYWGFDEGSMGYLDAVAAGVKTIVTPQGYHLDTKGGLTHPCRTIADFERTLLGIQNERKTCVSAVADWTWENYAKKHIEVWKYMLGQPIVNENQHVYEDGIYSVMPIDNTKSRR